MNLLSYHDYLDIPYLQLHFTAVSMGGDFPKNKTSALRGGTGRMMILQNCVLADSELSEADCLVCRCMDECLVQRFLYTPMRLEPELSYNKISMGYVFSCEDYRSYIASGDTFQFQVILFGKSRVYLNLLLQAIDTLGFAGLGKNQTKFQIVKVTNSRKKVIIDRENYGNSLFKENCQPETLASYVDYRMKQLKGREEICLKLQTETTLKYQGEILQELNFEAILAAAARRMYLFNCFEGNRMDLAEYQEMLFNSCRMNDCRSLVDSVKEIGVRRYSSRQREAMRLQGLKGELRILSIPKECLPTLLAGEITRIGKNTSFGFGRYHIF